MVFLLSPSPRKGEQEAGAEPVSQAWPQGQQAQGHGPEGASRPQASEGPRDTGQPSRAGRHLSTGAARPRSLVLGRFGKTEEGDAGFLFISWIPALYLKQALGLRHSWRAGNYFKHLKKLVNDVQHK